MTAVTSTIDKPLLGKPNILIFLCLLGIFQLRGGSVHAAETIQANTGGGVGYGSTDTSSYNNCQSFQLQQPAYVTSFKTKYLGTGGVATYNGPKIRTACNTGDIVTANGTWTGSIPVNTTVEYEWFFNDTLLNANQTYYLCFYRVSQKKPYRQNTGQYSLGSHWAGCANQATRDFEFTLYGYYPESEVSTSTILAVNEKNDTALIEMIALASLAAMLVSMFILL